MVSRYHRPYLEGQGYLVSGLGDTRGYDMAYRGSEAYVYSLRPP